MEVIARVWRIRRSRRKKKRNKEINIEKKKERKKLGKKRKTKKKRTNYLGSFTCTCNPGFVGNGSYCARMKKKKHKKKYKKNKTKQTNILNKKKKKKKRKEPLTLVVFLANHGFVGNGAYCAHVEKMNKNK